MKFLSTAAVIAAIGAPAFAGGLQEPAPEAVVVAPTPAPVYVAPGDWTGGYVGAQIGYGDVNTEGAINSGGNGAVGGVQAGYDYDFGGFVLGGEVDYNAANIDLDNNNGSLDNLTRAKLRAGYGMGNTLVYGVAGAAKADVNLAGTDYSESGYLVGAGVDYKLTDSVTMGGEVVYQDLGEVENTGTSVDATTVAAKLNYRF